MAVNVSPFGPKPQLELSDGTPAVGAKLFFYVAGSVGTKQNTYSDSTGGVANTNPIILDALGMPTTTQIWFTAGLGYKVVYAPSTDTDPPTSPIWTVDNLFGVNDVTASFDEWKAGPTPTFISATSFSLVGDQTATFQVGRRVKTTNTGGTVYSTITASAFGAVTTVTVANDSSTLDSGLSAVSYGLISATNPSIDADMIYRKGSVVTAAATTNIWGIVGDYVHISGATGITSFGTAPYAGARREVIFDSTPTITHNATTLICPGGVSVTAAAGDRAVIRADTTANMIIEDFVRAKSIPAKLPQGSLSGFGLLNNVADVTNDIDFSTGECRDSTNAVDLIALTAMTKQLDVAWAAGTAAGGRMSAAAIANTTYHLFVIRKDTDGTCDFGFDVSATAPTMPSGYTFFRRIGSIVRAGAAILPFINDGDQMMLKTPVQDVSTTTPGSAAVTATLASVPIGIRVNALINVGIVDTASNDNVYISDLSLADLAASATAAPGVTAKSHVANGYGYSDKFVMTNTSAQIRYRVTTGAATATVKINSLGWIDRRGRDS